MKKQMIFKPPLSKKKAHSISNGIFLISIAVLLVTNAWWPGILVALWATLTSRQYLTARYYSAVISTVIFLGLLIASIYQFNFDILAPVLLVVGGIFIIFREYFFPEDTNGEDKAAEIIEDAQIDE